VTVPALPVHVPLDPEALPVTFPVNAPANPVAVNIPVEGTKDNLEEDTFVGKFPVLAVTHKGYIVAAVDVSSVIVVAEA
jgi:hypothetical protein